MISLTLMVEANEFVLYWFLKTGIISLTFFEV